jgi:single-strand DNA-binding protein
MTNKVFLIGNICRDPELNTTPSGNSLCKFDLAVNRQFDSNGERKVDYFSCSAWRGTAEAIAKYCKKGHKICVIGSVQTRTYQDNENKKRTVYDIAVQEVEFLTAKATETGEFGTNASYSTHSSTDARTGRNKPILQEMEDDGDIPF